LFVVWTADLASSSRMLARYPRPRSGPHAALFASTQTTRATAFSQISVRTEQFEPVGPFFPAYAVLIGEINSRGEGRCAGFLERNKWTMTHIADNSIPKLRRAPQPPLSYPGAAADSDRTKKPRLAEPPANDQDLKRGDRVEGLGNFGKPTGEFDTVEQANEDDAVVKWDDAGRMRLHQPWLKKV